VKSYGQYCPIARAAEVLGERWTLLVMRNVLLGASTFNDIANGVPGMSRSLLTRRLDWLASKGLIEMKPKAQGRGKRYLATEAGTQLWHVLEPLAAWSTQWIELQPQHHDPSFVLWAWTRAHLATERLPKRGRVVVQFTFPDEPALFRRFWMLFERGAAELCHANPGFDIDLQVEAESEAFTQWHVGHLSWQAALRTGRIQVEGPATLARALPSWNTRA